MAVLEMLVIATLVLAGVWVGYNAWENSMTEDPYGKADAHDAGESPHLHDTEQHHMTLRTPDGTYPVA